MVALSKLLKVLADFPALQASLTVEQLLRFIDICCHLRPELDLNPSNNRNTPPLHLPENVATFLCFCIFSVLNQTSRAHISLAWDALSSFIWTMPFRTAPTECIDLFLEHGPKLHLGKYFMLNFLIWPFYKHGTRLALQPSLVWILIANGR